jgi:hypothetical protein
MGNLKGEQNKGKKKGFLAVDVWQSHFGPVSVKAIYSIFAEKFGIKPENKEKHTFSHCVNSLRRLENPDYTDPIDLSKESAYIFVPHETN